jgi:hypothetical protein
MQRAEAGGSNVGAPAYVQTHQHFAGFSQLPHARVVHANAPRGDQDAQVGACVC